MNAGMIKVIERQASHLVDLYRGYELELQIIEHITSWYQRGIQFGLNKAKEGKCTKSSTSQDSSGDGGNAEST